MVVWRGIEHARFLVGRYLIERHGARLSHFLHEAMVDSQLQRPCLAAQSRQEGPEESKTVRNDGDDVHMAVGDRVSAVKPLAVGRPFEPERRFRAACEWR